MSNFLEAGNTYDLTKNIKDIEVNTGFILSLDSILMFYFANLIEDPSTIPAMFKKFENILQGQDAESEENKLSYIERQIYTLFALNQLFKAKAKEQNLHVPLESKVTTDHLEAYMKDILQDKTEDAVEKLSKIQELIKPKSS
jgi:hypothetical protein